MLAFACSVIPNGVTAVLQERLFHEQPKLDIVLILFWSNVFSVIGQVLAFHLLHIAKYDIRYTLAIPIQMIPGIGGFSWTDIWDNQAHAFECFAGKEPMVCGCQPVCTDEYG